MYIELKKVMYRKNLYLIIGLLLIAAQVDAADKKSLNSQIIQYSTT